MRDGLVVAACSEIIFVESIGGDELLPSELVGLAGSRGLYGEIFVHGFVYFFGCKLLFFSVRCKFFGEKM